MNRNINIIRDLNGNEIVLINDIIFKGKRNIEWADVKRYLEQYVGELYEIISTGEVIFIGKELPSEYTGSMYTYKLKGTAAKAKANAAQAIPEMIEIAVSKHYREKIKKKHAKDAAKGWYRYDSRFGLPVYSYDGEVERYNIFHASLIVRHSVDDKMYLYDVIDIKKETSNPLQS